MSDDAAADSVVGEQIAALAADLDTLDGRELAERLKDLERLHRRLEHTIVTLVGEADRRVVWSEDGHRSVRGWCMATANWSHGDTSHRIRSAELLHDIDGCDEALAGGHVGVAQLRELARAHANPRCGDQLTDHATLLLGKAEILPYDEFRRVVQHWESLADADGAHRDHERTHERRTVSFEQLGVGWHLNAHGGTAPLRSRTRHVDCRNPTRCVPGSCSCPSPLRSAQTKI